MTSYSDRGVQMAEIELLVDAVQEQLGRGPSSSIELPITRTVKTEHFIAKIEFKGR